MNNQTKIDTSIRLFENALPTLLFDNLQSAVRAIGSERMKSNGSYSTTFWFARNTKPTNLAEQAVVSLFRTIRPPETCIGAEWWLGRLGNGKKLRFHFDRDLALQEKTGEVVCPILGSVLYLNDYPSTPTVVVGQVPGPDGKSKVPEEPTHTEAVEAIANRYMVFGGNLRHGVVPDPDKLGLDPKRPDGKPERRLTLLVNYWHQRPLAPICSEYDGSIYPSLLSEEWTGQKQRDAIPA